MQKLRFLIIGFISILLIGGSAGAVWIWRTNTTSNTNSSKSSPDQSSQSDEVAATEENAELSFDKTLYSIDDSSSIWVIANKSRPLESGYTPAELVAPDVPTRLAKTAEQSQVSVVIATPLKALFDAAAANRVSIKLSSGYRSEALQKQFYDSYVARDGQAAADTYSARPGTSEHQTGLAVDIINTAGTCSLETCFGDLPEGQWLAAHAHEYGFIIRYPEGKQDITGYQYEPWHIRYVGTDLAQELYTTNLTMEEFFNVF